MHRLVRGIACAAVSALALSTSACAPEHGAAYLSAFAAGERAFHAARWDEAADAWEGAAKHALRARDRDEARFLQARAQERAQRWGDARATYERLVAESADGQRTGRAVFEIAALEVAHGDAEKGFRMLDDAARKYPKHGLARLALHRLVDHEQAKGGDVAVLAFLDARVGTFRDTEQDEVVAYERALCLERMGRRKEAHDAFLATAARHPYPEGGLTDDAYWHAALIDDQDGRFEEAITHLRELLAPRERSIGVGSYERPRYTPAQQRIAEIYRDELKDRKAARREFDRLYEAHTTSRERDDALWAEARLALLDGDAPAACSLAKKITSEFPDSRFVRCAHEVCPSLPAGQRPCADYVLRELAADRNAGGAAREKP
jgi:tetratricopeptide (TPR) repeat protein